MYQLKLMPGAIPSSSFFKNVRSEVSAAVWNKLRSETYAAAGHKCEVCGGRYGAGCRWPLECHEVWSFDDSTRTQKLVRLIALCRSCHLTQHLGWADMENRYVETIEHLAKVNVVSVDVAHALADKAWKLWHERSEVQWNVDISVLYTDEVDFALDAAPGPDFPLGELVDLDALLDASKPASASAVFLGPWTDLDL